MIAALALTSPAAVAGGPDCDRAVERLGKAQIALAEAKAAGAPRKKIKRLKERVKDREKAVERECNSPGRPY